MNAHPHCCDTREQEGEEVKKANWLEQINKGEKDETI
jgi:hypothetical protein